MGLWTKNGALIVNSGGILVDCGACPCSSSCPSDALELTLIMTGVGPCPCALNNPDVGIYSSFSNLTIPSTITLTNFATGTWQYIGGSIDWKTYSDSACTGELNSGTSQIIFRAFCSGGSMSLQAYLESGDLVFSLVFFNTAGTPPTNPVTMSNTLECPNPATAGFGGSGTLSW